MANYVIQPLNGPIRPICMILVSRSKKISVAITQIYSPNHGNIQSQSKTAWRIFNRGKVNLSLYINSSLRAGCSSMSYSNAISQSLCSLNIGNLDIVLTSMPVSIFSHKILFALYPNHFRLQPTEKILNPILQSRF